MYRHGETGAGLIEYTPILLFLIFCLVSVFQVVIEGDRGIVWIVGCGLLAAFVALAIVANIKEKIGQKEESSS